MKTMWRCRGAIQKLLECMQPTCNQRRAIADCHCAAPARISGCLPFPRADTLPSQRPRPHFNQVITGTLATPDSQAVTINLKNCCTTMKQKIHITETVIRAGIVYGFFTVAFSLPTIHKLDKILIRLQKSIC